MVSESGNARGILWTTLYIVSYAHAFTYPCPAGMKTGQMGEDPGFVPT